MATVGSDRVTFTLNFNDPDFSDEERDEAARRLLAELKQMDEVEETGRILDPDPPAGNKAIGGFLVGMLTAEISVENTKALLGFLGDRLSGKTIELEVEANGKKLKVKASSQAELSAAIAAAQSFVAS